MGGRRDRVPHRVLLLPGSGRVVSQPVVVGAPKADQGREGGGVHPGLHAGRKARLDRLPGDLVAEREAGAAPLGDKYSMANAHVDRLGRLARHLADELERRAGSEDGSGAQDVARRL